MVPLPRRIPSWLYTVICQNSSKVPGTPLMTGPLLVRVGGILHWALWLMRGPLLEKQRSLVREALQFSSVAQLCLALGDPMNHSTPGLPVHHQLPEFTQTHVHQVGDAIQPSHPLSSTSPPAPNPSQHQGLFQ